MRGHPARNRARNQLMRLRDVRLQRAGGFAEKDADDSGPVAQQAPSAIAPQDNSQYCTDDPVTGLSGCAGNDGDLMGLPGAGEGLVWLLQQRDIRSLSDVAAFQTEQLAQVLGPLGQLVDVGGWIDHARQRAPADPALTTLSLAE